MSNRCKERFMGHMNATPENADIILTFLIYSKIHQKLDLMEYSE